MQSNTQDIESIFLAAAERPTAERSAYLDEVCSGDAPLRARVERLLAAQSKVSSFLETPAPELGAAANQPAIAPGTQIGPYKLIEQIGEGGMGVVFLAEQQQPIKRRVALKIIKPGMDTREVIARFEAERQALAMMDHPNIAKVFDAGTTGQGMRNAEFGMRNEDQSAPSSEIPHSAGRPYFAMELVQGVPITEYCDECQLTTRDRLELFVTVCRAVQHAHQQGIIHRDLKPTNVLVGATNDQISSPHSTLNFRLSSTVKIIDFGVAKAMNQRLTDRTLTSGFAQMLGTPLYMSPEQAELSPLGVDTRSDVYSLGVLLYELLTGTTPFDKDRLHTASYDEVRRIIREEEPPRPSARISTFAADAATTIATRRRTDTRRLVQTVRGELDWIVMKALDKDRNRRYESASDLARDIESYLANEPVHACPPSRAYRLRKFIRKHKWGISAAGAVFLAASMGGILATFGLVLAVHERRNAELERDQANTNLYQGIKLIDDAIAPAFDQLEFTPHLWEIRTKLLEQSIRFHEGLGKRARQDAAARHSYAKALIRLAEAYYHEARDMSPIARRAMSVLAGLTREQPHSSTYRLDLASAHRSMSNAHATELRWRFVERESLAAITILQRVITDGPPNARAYHALAFAHRNHAVSLWHMGLMQRASDEFEAALRAAEQIAPVHDGLQEGHFAEVTIHCRFAELLILTGRFAQAKTHLDVAQSLAESGIAKAPTISERLIYEWWLADVERFRAQLQITLGHPEISEQSLAGVIDRFTAVVAQVPENAWGQYLLGCLHHWRGVALAALEKYDDAVKAQATGREHLLTSGTSMGRYVAARVDWQLGDLCYLQGRKAEGDGHLLAALNHFNTVVQRLPKEPAVHEPLIVFLCTCPNAALRNYERAARLAERFVNETNGHALMWRYLALARYRAGDWAGAEEAIQLSKQLRYGGDALDMLLEAALQFQLGDQSRARELYGLAEASISDNEPIYYGHIGVIAFGHLRNEIRQLLDKTLSTTERMNP